MLVKKWIFGVCLALTCLVSVAPAIAAKVELLPSSRVILKLTADMNLDEIVRRVYPEDSTLWPEVKQALIDTNPGSFEAGTDQLIPGASLQLVDIKRVVEQPDGRVARPAGKVIAVSGAVSVVDSSDQAQLAQPDTTVFEGDRLVSGPDASLHLRLIDGAEIFLKADSVIEISQYGDDQADAENRSLVDLLRGGLRTVTGAIGVEGGGDYRLETGHATVGIRGTEYIVMLCHRDDCRKRAGRDEANAWLHAAVLEGEISLRDADEDGIVLAAGEYGSRSTGGLSKQPSSGLPPGFLTDDEAARFEAESVARNEGEAASSKRWLWIVGLLLLAVGL